MSDIEESNNKQDEPVEPKKKSERKSDSDTKECNCEDCKGCSDCKHENGIEELRNPSSAEFIEDLERKWTTEDELTHIEERMDRSEQNPRKIFKSLKKKIFNFR